MSGLQFVSVLLAIACGAMTQRVTGLGFALVSAPLLILAAGPHEGVLLANVLSLAGNCMVITQTWRDGDLKHALLLAVPAIVVMPPSNWVALQLPTAPLMIGIGTITLLALGFVLTFRQTRIFSGGLGAVAAGALSGFMQVTAGVGGPAMTLYAISTNWVQRGFAASMQMYFAMLNVAAIAIKGWPQQPVLQMGAMFAALFCGVVLGALAAPHVPGHRARQAVTALAILGAFATVVKGFMSL